MYLGPWAMFFAGLVVGVVASFVVVVILSLYWARGPRKKSNKED